MVAVPTVGKGVALKIGNGASPEVFTAIGKIENVSIAGRDRQIVSFTTHDVDYIQKLASFIENGQITLGVAYDSGDTQHALLETLFESGAVTNYKIELTDTGARIFAFNAIVKGVSYPDAKTAVTMMNVSLEICESWDAS